MPGVIAMFAPNLSFLAVVILWIYAIVDVLRRQFRDSIIKLIWVLVIILVPLLGAILYLIIGRQQGSLT